MVVNVTWLSATIPSGGLLGTCGKKILVRAILGLVGAHRMDDDDEQHY